MTSIGTLFDIVLSELLTVVLKAFRDMETGRAARVRPSRNARIAYRFARLGILSLHVLNAHRHRHLIQRNTIFLRVDMLVGLTVRVIEMAGEAMLKVAILALVIGVSRAQAADTRSLLKEKGCLACHHESKPRIGPAFESIAAKQCADPGAAQARFTAKLRDGAGHPKAALDDIEFDQLIRWTCSLKRD